MKNTYKQFINQIDKVAVDKIDDDITYTLYLVETNDASYYYVESTDVMDSLPTYRPKETLYRTNDFTARELEIAKYIFTFLYDSDNGCSTGIDSDVYEDDGFTKKEMKKFINKFKWKDSGLEMDDDTVNVYWDYLCWFDVRDIDMWN